MSSHQPVDYGTEPPAGNAGCPGLRGWCLCPRPADDCWLLALIGRGARPEGCAVRPALASGCAHLPRAVGERREQGRRGWRAPSPV